MKISASTLLYREGVVFISLSGVNEYSTKWTELTTVVPAIAKETGFEGLIRPTDGRTCHPQNDIRWLLNPWIVDRIHANVLRFVENDSFHDGLLYSSRDYLRSRRRFSLTTSWMQVGDTVPIRNREKPALRAISASNSAAPARTDGPSK